MFLVQGYDNITGADHSQIIDVGAVKTPLVNDADPLDYPVPADSAPGISVGLGTLSSPAQRGSPRAVDYPYIDYAVPLGAAPGITVGVGSGKPSVATQSTVAKPPTTALAKFLQSKAVIFASVGVVLVGGFLIFHAAKR